MSQEAQKLLRMKDQMKELEAAVSRTEGEHNQLLKSLKDEFNLADIAKAKKMADKMASDLTKDKQLLQQGVQELEADYEWGT